MPFRVIALVLILLPIVAIGQERTGRPYSTAEPKTPPPPGPQARSPLTFTDITTQSGINFMHAASKTSSKYLLETMGGGVAILDYDNDGRMDLFFTNGAALKDHMSKDDQPDKTQPRYWNRLYQQKPDGTFSDVTERAGLKGTGYSMGVAAADYDNDGFVDLFVTGYKSDRLYRNNGDGTFSDATGKLPKVSDGWSTSAGWFDYDRDGRLDLFVAHYMEWDFDNGSLFCGGPTSLLRAYCHPDNFKGAANILFHQRADGSFEDVSKSAGIADPAGKGLGVAFADFDNDGWTDVFVANDSVRQSFYRNKGDGTFEDIAVISGAAYDEDGKTFAGMGIDCADYDNDGYTDVFITTLSNEKYALYRNSGDLSFTYTTNTSAVGQITLLNSGWGARFVDVDNDGLRDLFVAQSHVLDTVEKSTAYLKYRQPLLLMRNTGKGFVNISATAGSPFAVPLAARGVAVGDLNNDGQPDAVVAVIDAAPVVLKSNGTANHWLGLTLVGSKSNRSALGARVTVTNTSGQKQIFDVGTASSYLSSSDPRIVVGLGAAKMVKTIEIRWPSGRVQSVPNSPLDRYTRVIEQ